MTRSSLSRLLASAAVAVPLAFAGTAATAQNTNAPDNVFKRADANGDGKLSKDEVAGMPTIAAKFTELDKDKDGFLSLTEFMAGYKTTSSGSGTQ